MKILYNGLQVEILKVFRGQSTNYKGYNSEEFADLIRVKFASGKIEVICATQLIN